MSEPRASRRSRKATAACARSSRSISPSVDGGRFAVKRVVGDEVVVEADCFADGHDVARCPPAVAPRTPSAHGARRRWRRSATTAGAASFAVDDARAATATPSPPGSTGSCPGGTTSRVASTPRTSRVAALVGAELVEQAAARAAGRRPRAARGAAQRLRRADDPEALRARRARRGARGTRRRAIRTAASRSRIRSSCRSSWTASARASAPGTRCSRARRRRSRAGTARFRDCEARLPYVAAMGFDVLYLPPIHPIGRDNRKGPNNALGRGAGRRRAARGRSARPRAGTRRSTPSSARSRTSGDSSRAAREHGIEIALDIAFQCSPDHPYVQRAPAVVPPAPGRHDPVRREPAQEVPGHLPVRLRDRATGAALWEELEERLRLLDRRRACAIFRVDNPHTKPFAVLGMADRRGQARRIPT